MFFLMVSQHLNDESVDGDEMAVPFDRSSLLFETDSIGFCTLSQ